MDENLDLGIEIEVFDTEYFTNCNILIIGNCEKENSLLIKDIILTTSYEETFNYYSVLTKFVEYYSEFVNRYTVYRRYSDLFYNRLFTEKICLVMDGYEPPNTDVVKKIYSGLEDKDMLFLTTYFKHWDIIDFDYIFLTSKVDKNILDEICSKYTFIPYTYLELVIDNFFEEDKNKGNILVINITEDYKFYSYSY